MKKRLLTLLLAVSVFLSGCWQELPVEDPGDLIVDDSPPVETPPAPAADTRPAELTLGWLPDVTLDPLTCPDGMHLTLAPLLYEGLFRLDESFTPQPVLCSEFSCDDTGTVWTFRIRSDILFSDGSALTAADVAAALNRARDTDRYRSRLSGISQVTRKNDIVTVTLSAPNTSLPALLDIPVVKSGTEKTGKPLGTGPYALAEDDRGTHLQAAGTYRASVALPVQAIRLLDCSGSNALRHQFSSQNVQLITADLIGSDPYTPVGSIRISDADTTVLQYIGFNTSRPVFADAAVRNALGLGIDRKTLTEACLAGHALPAQSPISPRSPLYPAMLDVDYSLTTFTEAMAAAGCAEGTVHEVSLLVNEENSFKLPAARYIAESLSVCDIRITVRALPWEEYLTALQTGDFDLYYGEVRLTADWDLRQLVGSGGSLNYAGYDNTAVDAFLNSCASATEDNRADALLRLFRSLRMQAPILPLCFRRTSVLTHADVVEGLSPIASDPFNGLEHIRINLKEPT